MKKNVLYASLCVVALAGCAGLGSNEISLKEKAPAKAVAPQMKYAASVRITGFVDERKAADPRQIGITEARVAGMSGTELRLDRDVTDAVAESLSKKLDQAGLQVRAREDGSALFELSGVIKQLTYDVKERDYVTIVLESTLKETATGQKIWSGVVTEKRDRFAGVGGNSKSDIAAYFKEALAVVSAKTSEALNATLMAARPDLFALTPGTKAIEGVTVYTASGGGAAAQPAAAVAVPLVAVVPSAKPLATATNGLLQVSTEPARAKVYLDGVYYGLSPLSVEAAPGVHKVEAKLKGYKTTSEKVSVRKGDKTDLELTLDK